MVGPTPAYAVGGSTWTIRSSAADNAWYGVTYGNGLFVAVSQTGTGNRVMTSPDGINWTIRSSAADNSWRSITYGNGLFVAVTTSVVVGNNNQVMTSPDGITWTSRASAAAATWNSVTYGNGLFVAVAQTGTGNRVMTSPDGITWTSRTSAANNTWTSVTYGNGLFVAVSITGTGNRVMTSPAVDAPTITAISPAYGMTAGGTTTTITGTGFVSGGISGVTFGGTAATNVTYVSATSITATTPVHAAGTASVLVTTPGGTNTANTLFKYTDCGPGVPLTTGVGSLWQMLALPCVPTTNTIAGVFGSSTLSNLTTANYAIDQTNVAAADKTGWILQKKTVGATPAYEPLLTSNLALSVGTGYWIKSYQAPTNDLLSMDGTATATDVTQAQGCASANGCKAITVTTYNATANRYNLVGNPFPYAVDWSKVRIRVDGSASTLTPSEAETANVLSKTVNIWNGTTYIQITDNALNSPSSPLNLQYFKSFFVNVLSGAFGHTVELLIPAEQSTLSLNSTVVPEASTGAISVATTAVESVATVDLPWYLGWLDVVIPPAAAAGAVTPVVTKPLATPQNKNWFIRLKVTNPVTGWTDQSNKLGEISTAKLAYDSNDIPEMPPFTEPYLTLLFPHTAWGAKAGDYASDFHPYSDKAQTWNFEIRAKPIGSKVFLNWEGSATLLKRSRLIEVATGKTIVPTDTRWKVKGYPITLKKAVQAYTWKVLP